MTRNQFNQIFGGVSVLAAIASLVLAVCPLGLDPKHHKEIGYFVVATWVLLPPFFFWVDWVMFREGLSDKEKEAAKHTHDLSRNIWLGLVTVLAVAFQLTDKIS
jgi:hypothetical protein